VAINIDLTRNLTQKRLPAELQGFDTYRVIIWEIDPDIPGRRMVYDIYEISGEKSVIAMFNSSRAWWASEGMQVSMEAFNYN